MLAGNRLTQSIVCDAAAYQRGAISNTVSAIMEAAGRVSDVLGRPVSMSAKWLSKRVRQQGAVPIEIWTDLSPDELARFAEHANDFPGFMISENEVRIYPEGALARSLLGSVRLSPIEPVSGDRIYWASRELKGVDGLEYHYDSYLRGNAGEDRVRINSLGYATERYTVTPAKSGFDLRLTLDSDIQREAEAQLADVRGACVVLDARTGDVLAAASSPGYFLAFGGEYAPGSTFKPITALAGLLTGSSPADAYACTGVFRTPEMRLRCTSRWGHGPIDLRHALMKSCNPYFCNLALMAGTNVLCSTARAFGLGRRTGVDFILDRPGLVPDDDYKERVYHRHWNSGDLIQMAIGQGMLLVTPLQMARMAAALGTGHLVRPRLNADLPVERTALPFPEDMLNVVREGMRMVVSNEGNERGTGWRGGEGVPVQVCGKTGTAEVGSGEKRHKNAWFIAYAPAEAPSVAVAMVVEHGEGGGMTTAPRVAQVLRRCFEQ